MLSLTVAPSRRPSNVSSSPNPTLTTLYWTWLKLKFLAPPRLRETALELVPAPEQDPPAEATPAAAEPPEPPVKRATKGRG